LRVNESSRKPASKVDSASGKTPKTPQEKSATAKGKKRKRSTKANVESNRADDWNYSAQDADLADQQLVTEARGFDPFSGFNNLPTGFSPERPYGNEADYYDQTTSSLNPELTVQMRRSVHGSYGAIQSPAEDEPPKKKRTRKKKGAEQATSTPAVAK
jgi:hypothetical protein